VPIQLHLLQLIVLASIRFSALTAVVRFTARLAGYSYVLAPDSADICGMLTGMLHPMVLQGLQVLPLLFSTSAAVGAAHV
jgi:hypothetical protein